MSDRTSASGPVRLSTDSERARRAGGDNRGVTLKDSDPLAVEAVQAVHNGDLEALRRLLTAHPELATARIENSKGATCTLLHKAADWPGYFSNGPEVVRLLIEAGAEPSAPVENSWHAETPLHWAASSDDVDVAEALVDGGADIEALGASIAGGTPLDDAVAYGCWRVARLLVARGAKVERLWHAAALGMLTRVRQMVDGSMPPPSPSDISNAFYQACSGGQRRVAEYLLAHGADINWVPVYAKNTPLAAASGSDTGRAALISWLRERGANAEPPST